jgi:PHD/YefM family antitoxin component YafN of YafNO toxin-antitoxin module
MAVSATQLRQNIYAILDEALATGKPVEIERKGKVLRIVPDAAPEQESDEDYLKEFPRLARLKNHNIVIGNPEDLATLEWSDDWTKLVPRKTKKTGA